ncbi:MAG TPA: hypothetical protein VKI62_07865, partial [Bacteroidota bacterium]|nr:hypothetical protein [Bacteroidota bacterium]
SNNQPIMSQQNAQSIIKETRSHDKRDENEDINIDMPTDEEAEDEEDEKASDADWKEAAEKYGSVEEFMNWVYENRTRDYFVHGPTIRVMWKERFDVVRDKHDQDQEKEETCVVSAPLSSRHPLSSVLPGLPSSCHGSNVIILSE